ncbi:hypothetical protein TNIN_372351 [Trichonephila inaurata madagascariensis]|uniref:Uncharacterized protein n=1 Tax=Trichonephila inaurata madagascariensis TaxID=2747483 RepID=A0A8X6YDZ6_9ARAC|nr:hypothetical protein TNIN_372351 [Trichonephila inaurata madagascariensis]
MQKAKKIVREKNDLLAANGIIGSPSVMSGANSMLGSTGWTGIMSSRFISTYPLESLYSKMKYANTLSFWQKTVDMNGDYTERT